ncbi:MAG TPA: hypothetical protein VFJ07_15315 [Streptosporangiaceae bacterium]|nr:hypothetical protein [Streptosporangiaceae bacterium]
MFRAVPAPAFTSAPAMAASEMPRPTVRAAGCQAALQMGFAGVHAIQMRLRDQVIGTPNLFRRAPHS